MGKMLTMKDIEKMAVAKEMPLGITEAVFEKIEYRIDEANETVIGAYVHFQGYRSIYLPFTDGEINYQLDYLLEQLGVESYALPEINATTGSVVKISRYIKETEKNYSKDEFFKLKKKFEGVLPTYLTVRENEEGATVTSTFTNTNFNLKTIKEQ